MPLTQDQQRLLDLIEQEYTRNIPRQSNIQQIENTIKILTEEGKTPKNLLFRSETDIDGGSPLHLAIKYNLEEVVKLLLKTGPKNYILYDNETGWNSFYELMVQRKLSLIDVIVKNGSFESMLQILDDYDKNSNGLQNNWKDGFNSFSECFHTTYKDNYLLLSCNMQDLKAVSIALELSADVHVDNDMPLRLALNKNDIKLIKLLIEKGANVEANDNEFIRLAVDNLNVEAVRILLEKGAKPYVFENNYLMSIAIGNGNIQIIKLLSSKGARIPSDMRKEAKKIFLHANIRQELDDAIEHKNDIIISLLIDLGANCNEGLRLAIEKNDLDMTKKFLSLGADLRKIEPNLIELLNKRGWKNDIDSFFHNQAQSPQKITILV